MITETLTKMQHLFDETPVILYIGRKGRELISDKLICQKWSMIITTLVDDALPNMFNESGRRRAYVFDTKESFESLRLNTRELPVVCINGTESLFSKRNNSFEAEADFDINRAYLIDQIYNVTSESFATLVIIGYDRNDNLEISSKDLFQALRYFTPGTVVFFDTTNELNSDERIRRLSDLGIVDAITDNPNSYFDHLVELDYDESLSLSGALASAKTFYLNNKRLQIDKDKLFETDGFCSLLNLEDLRSIVIPKNLEHLWFYQFLQQSAKMPQWFGYAPNTKFAIERGFFTSFLDVVKCCLEKKTKIKEVDEERVIILSGQTGSGKSIALAQVAYTVFSEKKYPVIFIHNPDVMLSEGMPALTALDNLIMEIENLGADKILLVWDCSIYNFIRNNYAANVLNALINRGRKVCLVCSAMELPADISKFEIDVKTGVTKSKRYHVVKAPIELTTGEKESLKGKLYEVGHISREKISWYFETRSESNLLSLLYQLFEFIHPQLRQGLYKEISQSVLDVREQIIDLPRSESEITLIGKKLQELGFVDTKKDTSDSDAVEAGKSFEFFCNSLAVGSQFKISIPLSFAVRLLGTTLSSQSQKIRELVFSVPWISATPIGMDSSMLEYEISFRTPIEAKMYLDSRRIDAQQQVEIVAQIVKMLTKSNAHFFSDEIRYLEKLIRMIGPNSDSQAVLSNSGYKKNYPVLIDALASLRSSGVYEPRIVAQEITLIREYHQFILNDDADKELSRVELIKAVVIARELITSFERSNYTKEYQNKLYNSIVVENANCEYALKKLYQGKSDESAFSSYEDTFQRLYDVITQDPNDSYPYTALFKWFLEEYKDPSLKSETRIKYLSEIIDLIESSRMIRSEGIEYYQAEELISIIYKLVNGPKEQAYFNELCGKGSGSGIFIKAISILQDAKITLSEVSRLTQNVRKTCTEVLCLFEKYTEIVNNHSGCLRLKIQIKWLLYNSEPYFVDERKTTALNNLQWREIGGLCSDYITQFVASGKRIQGAYVYYYLLALSKAQLEDFLGALDVLRPDNIFNFSSQIRIKVWYLLCDENGKPKTFKGRLEPNRFNKAKKTGHLSIAGHTALNNVYYFLPNMKTSSESGTFNDIILGINFLGFNAFRA